LETKNPHTTTELLLDLVSTTPSPSSSFFLFPVLGTYSGSDMSTRGARNTEISSSSSGTTLSTQEEGVGTKGRADCELVKSETFTTSVQDAGSCALSKSQSADREFGEVQEPGVICDCPNNYSNVTLAVTFGEPFYFVERQGGSVGPAHAQPLQNNAVEGGASPTSQEFVEPHQEEEVGISALGILSGFVLQVLVGEIYTHSLCGGCAMQTGNI